METIRILLADHHVLFREGVRTIVDRQSDMIVVGEAEDGLEATKKASELAPDIVLMDINMPGLDGVTATRFILAQNPQVGIIVLTMQGENKHVLEAIKAGARGYILKSAQAGDLIEAIHTVHRGGSVLNAGVMNTLLEEFLRLADEQGGNLVGLSRREAEILRLVAQGKTNKEIADLLSLSEQTIKNRLSTLYLRLKVANRTEAVTYAVQQGLISLE